MNACGCVCECECGRVATNPPGTVTVGGPPFPVAAAPSTPMPDPGEIPWAEYGMLPPWLGSPIGAPATPDTAGLNYITTSSPWWVYPISVGR